uniref:Nuclear receptor n=2 Tax=Meloidogyne incognita TaxID=6306 RepID=A0A914MNU1_MELIC
MLIGEFNNIITQQENQQKISPVVVTSLKPFIFSIKPQKIAKLSGTPPSPLSPLTPPQPSDQISLQFPSSQFVSSFQTFHRRRSSVYSVSEGQTTTSRDSSSTEQTSTIATASISRNPPLGHFEQQLSRSLESLSMDELFGAGQSPEQDKQQQTLNTVEQQEGDSMADDQLLRQIIDTLIDEDRKSQSVEKQSTNTRPMENQQSQSEATSSSSFRPLIPEVSSSIKQELLVTTNNTDNNSNTITSTQTTPFPSWSPYKNLFPATHPAFLLRGFELSATTSPPFSSSSSLSPTSLISGNSLSQMQLPLQLQQQFTMSQFQHPQQQKHQPTYSQQQQRRQTISCSVVTTMNQQRQQQHNPSILTMAGQQQQHFMEASALVAQQTSAANLMRGFEGMFSTTPQDPQHINVVQGGTNIIPQIPPSAMTSVVPHLPQSIRGSPLSAAMLSAAFSSTSTAVTSSSNTGICQNVGGQAAFISGGSPSTSSSHHQMDDEFSQVDESKICAVCNDYAVCQHYGALTCEGCKGFFKRTVQKKSQYVCSGEKKCPIDKKYRSRCQYCRFQKCLDVGMVREIVRFGSLTGRRGRLPSKVKSSSITSPSSSTSFQMSSLGQPEPAQSPPLPILTIISKAFNEIHGQLNTACRREIKQRLSLNEFCSILELELQNIWGFARRIPDIVELNEAELRLLILHNFFPIFAVRQAFRWAELKTAQIPEDFWFEGGICLKTDELPVEWSKWFCEVTAVAHNFRMLIDWDIPCLASLIVLQIFKVGPSISGMITQTSVERFNSTYINALKDHCCQSSTQPSKLSRIVAQVSQFEPFRHLGSECLGASLRQLTTQPSQTLTQLYLNSGGNLKIGGGGECFYK